MHDGRVDKAAVAALKNEPTMSMTHQLLTVDRLAEFIKTDAHTHADHNAARQLMNGFSYQSPSIPPRSQEQKRHMLQRFEPRGRHAFDNYNLPVIE